MEFGSDYHRIYDFPCSASPFFSPGEYRLYYDGRQALEAVLIHEKIKRLWVPAYYCHESLLGVRRLGVKIEFYSCIPADNPDKAILNLQYEKGDALLRMNYFGLQTKPRTPEGPFLLIEDHSHGLSGSWAKGSDADWCFASLRKSLPIADGGVLWSPKKRKLSLEPLLSQAALENSVCRYAAMELKADFIVGNIGSKDIFLSEFRRTENNFEDLDISAISHTSKEIVESIDIDEWNRRKKDNWSILFKHLVPAPNYHILDVEDETEKPFSLVLLFVSQFHRDRVMRALISMNVYPAVLWRIPDGNDRRAVDFGNRILSIHCDARYTSEQMLDLADIINKTLNND